MMVYLCPTDTKYACSWEGQSDNILEHFLEEHEELYHSDETFFIDLKISSENRLFFIDNEIYLVQIKVCEKNLDIKLRYLGPNNIAQKISYKIILRINSNLLDSKYIIITKEGSFSIDLSKVNEDISEITCTLNINKNLIIDDDDDDDDVFKEVDTEQCISVKQKKHTKKIRKLSIEQYSSTTSTTISKTEVSLSRSKTISVDEIKRRNLKRAKSTVSLGAITEIETDSSTNCMYCGTVLSPPIFLCPCENSYCANCQNVTCKLCLQKVTFARNICLEEKFNKFLVTCKYKNNGCPEKLVYTELPSHVANCTFCDYKCPIDGCYFEGQFKHVCNHLKLIHGTTKILESFIVVFQKIPEAFLINEEKGIFYCYVEYFEDGVKWEAKFCGPKERRFFCELKFKEGKLKQPLLLNRQDNIYNCTMSYQELKRMKVKAKNAVLTVTC